MENTINSPVTELLQNNGIDFTLIKIPLSEDKKPIRHLETLLSSNDLDPNSIVRSVLFRGGSDQFYLLAAAGEGRADWGILRKHLGERKLRMAEYDEVTVATGYVVGAVPPIALPNSMPVLVDTSVNKYETVVIGSGVLGYALALKRDDLLKLLGDSEQGVFVKEA